MVILTLLDPQQKTPLRQWRFESQTYIRIGRAPDNHVVLPNALVSRYHLELRQIAQFPGTTQSSQKSIWQLVSRSTNGTFLNGDPILQGQLPPDALIQLAQDGPILRIQMLETLDSPAPPSAPLRTPQLPVIPDQPLAIIPSSQIPPSNLCSHAENPPGNLFCMHCGQPIRVQKTIRQYQVLQVLGKGGMGTTYLVWSRGGVSTLPGQSKGTLLVMKEMNADMAQIPKAQELFEREASVLKALRHSGIPKFYNFFMEAGKRYLVMELIHGKDLEKWVRQKGPIPANQAIAWMIQTCEVLEYLHSHPTPVIHRDIKPSNLLVRATDHRIVVLDFGAVKAAGMASGTRIGAEGYCAPEQTQGRALIQSDLYAIGPCLIFLLTGEIPSRFYNRSRQDYRFNVEEVPAIAPKLRKVIERVTSPRPIDRYRSARDLAQALANCF